MARLSKIHKFEIHEDSGIPTPDPSDLVEFVYAKEESKGTLAEDGAEQCFTTPCKSDIQEAELLNAHRAQYVEEADDERRESTLTTATVSSYPESTYPTDNEFKNAKYQPYTPPVIRPSFRRAESVRRMQLASPPPFGSRSPRRSIISQSRSRTGTPRSVRSVNAKGSPRPRKRISEETEGDEEVEQKHYPLVLLHATLLPLTLPWSMESMQELLPTQVLDNLQLLRSKVSDTVLQRGILISHPREEYELLEERLLEALELKEQRITKCGHYRGRTSTNSWLGDSGRDSDSGLGSSSDGSDGEPCPTCLHTVRTAKSGVGSKNRRWKIRVFAANGLLRSSAWSAVWPEMERVDVEILPWISDELRRQLDKRREEEEFEERERLDDEEERIKEFVEEQVRLAHEEMRRNGEVEETPKVEENINRFEVTAPQKTSHLFEAPSPESNTKRQLTAPTELPRIYPPSQIPLSILLRNYIYLLAHDRRNILIAVLGIVTLFIAMRPGSAPDQATLPVQGEACAGSQPVSSPLAMLGDATGRLLGGVKEVLTYEAGSEIADYGIEPLVAGVLEDKATKDEYASGSGWPKFEASEIQSEVKLDDVFEVLQDES